MVASDAVLLARLQSLWGQETGDAEGWPSVSSALVDVCRDVRVISDNYISSERLSYEGDSPVTTIVVGGNTLSRGLTLEGLVSSYFVRAASAYDTLLQMGRWFGYREGYEDLCRVWMTDELRNWFRDLAGVELEIREEIRRMILLGLTPAEVGVRVRKHPAMVITAAAKMRGAATVHWSYGGTYPQTTLLEHQNASVISDNWRAVENLLSDKSLELRAEGNFWETRATASEIQEFIADYSTPDRLSLMRPALLQGYISRELASGSLAQWRVVVVNGRRSSRQVTLGSQAVNVVVRSRLKADEGPVANIRALVGGADRAKYFGLPGNTPKAVVDVTRLRQAPGEGIVWIYAIDAESKATTKDRVDLQAAADVIGVSLDFPDAVNVSNFVDFAIVDGMDAVPENLEVLESELEAAEEQDDIR